MKCPRCEAVIYRQDNLEEGLTALKCGACKGCWINSSNYWSWYEANKDLEHAPPDDEIVVDVPAIAHKKGKLCPECKALLIPSKVGQGHEFAIDRCGVCGGFWFDRNEWEALRSTNHHREVHNIATHVWQQNLRKDNTRTTMKKLYEGRFDGPTMERLHEIHEWIHGHPQKTKIISYLLDDDPYEL